MKNNVSIIKYFNYFINKFDEKFKFKFIINYLIIFIMFNKNIIKIFNY